MQTLTGNIHSADRPFQGQGVSVYAGEGQPRYRKIRAIGRRLTPLRTAFTGDKTARLAFEAATAGPVSLDATLPAELIDVANVAIDARHYRDDAENESSAPQIVSVDSGGDGEDVIDGRAILIEPIEVRTGGSVRIRWRYEHSRGTPAQFRLHRLSGPTSPTDVTVTYLGPDLYEADFSSLSSGTYTFALSIENTGATVTTTLISPISVTPDATGPDAPTILTAEVR